MEFPAPLRRMLNNQGEFTRFVQDELRLPNGDFVGDVVERVAAFWKDKGITVHVSLMMGTLATINPVFTKDLS